MLVLKAGANHLVGVGHGGSYHLRDGCRGEVLKGGLVGETVGEFGLV